jgi:hypothetical protein
MGALEHKPSFQMCKLDALRLARNARHIANIIEDLI